MATAGGERITFTDGLHSFGQQGHAPFGYANMDVGNQIYVPQIEDTKPGEPQPVYHLKVTATPVDTRERKEPPEYVVVSSYPNQEGATDEVECPREGGANVVAHVLPSQRQAPGFTIKPIYQTLPPQQPSIVSSQTASTPLEKRFPTPPSGQAPSGYVHVYGAADEGQKPHPPGGVHFEQGGIVSRPVTVNAELLKAEEGGRSKIYNWIIPTTAAVTGMAQEAGSALEERQALTQSYTQDLEGVFAQASRQLQEPQEEKDEASVESPGRPHILSSPTDEALGLPKELRPTVVYAGVEHAPPEFAGTKGPLGYKLHAIEVHQYIPIPQKEDPWIIKNQMDPSTTAIFGPMPLPFDPAHSGMVAPTFQRTIDNHPAPVLCPEVARMFNHELPVVNYVTTTPTDTPAN